MTSSETPSRPSQETPPWAAGAEGRLDEIYPVLSPEEIEVLRGYGEEKEFADGTRIWEIGSQDTPFYLVLEGGLDILRRDDKGEHILVTHHVGSYSGEIVTMAGRGAFVAGRANGDLRALSIESAQLRDLLALEAELGEKILLSFILRRMRMISAHLGDVFLLGQVTDKQTSALREFLSRNGVPYDMVDPQAPEDKQRREKLGIDGADWPLVVCGHSKLSRPNFKEVADCLGMTARLTAEDRFDVAVIGAGPAGLAAAVYAASEGLSVVVLERMAVGGQAGSSSRIENYLGFPTGISGQALTGRGFLQAQKFGAQVALAREAKQFIPGTPYHGLVLENGDTIRAKAVIIASGAVYRQPAIEGLGNFEGSAVHYGASHIQSMLCKDKHVVIVGGGNSAGQAAMYLARPARKVSIVIRGPSLASSMSNYLIRRIDNTPDITLMPHTEVQRLESVGGTDAVGAIHVRNNQTGEETRLDASHLFIFIGAVPASGFAGDSILLDEKGFVKTGDALPQESLDQAGWTLERRPFLLETSCPRVFAVGDIRSGSVKRVASAVGEGSVCIQFIHKAIEGLE